MLLALCVSLAFTQWSGLNAVGIATDADPAQGDPPPVCVFPFDATRVTTPFAPAICNLPERPNWLTLNVTFGRVPSWLHGTLYRNVPAKYSFGEDQVRHWFDGMSQLQGYVFDGDGVRMHSRFMNTSTWDVLQNATEFDYVGFGTPPFPGPLFPANGSRRRSMEQKRSPEHYDHRSNPSSRRRDGPYGKPDLGAAGPFVNNDVSLMHIAGRFFATSDVDRYVEFDGDTLETLTATHYEFADNISLESTTAVAHGPVDAAKEEYFNVAQHPMGYYTGQPVEMVFWKLEGSKLNETAGANWSRVRVGSIATKNGTYVHSLGLTKNYVAWMELPIAFNMWDLMFGSVIIDAMEDLSHDGVPVKIHLLPRENATAATTITAIVPWRMGCVFHTGNTYEDTATGTLVYDAVRYDDCMVYDAFMLETMFTDAAKVNSIVGTGRLTRCRVPLFSGPEVVADCADMMPNTMAAFPWYNKQFHMLPYRWAYTTVLFHPDLTHGTVAKIDLTRNATVAVFSMPGRVLTEALFVPRFPNEEPTADNEDAGALVTISFNLNTKLSEIIALDARNLKPIFIVELPFAVPLHFHGIFCRPKQVGKKRYCLWN